MSDLVVNVRQVSSYPLTAPVPPSATLLLQTGGLGGPYISASASALVSTALQSGPALGVGIVPPANAAGFQAFIADLCLPSEAQIIWNGYGVNTGGEQSISGGPAGSFGYSVPVGWNWAQAPGAPGQLQWYNLMVLSPAGALQLPLGTLTVARDPASALEVATMGWVGNQTVGSFNGRKGAVQLSNADVLSAIGACAPVATQDWVIATIGQAFNQFMATQPLVLCWNGRTGAVYLTLSDITCVFFQPGQQPITPTPPSTSDDYSIANTAWVTNYVTGTIAGEQGLATQAWVQANTVASFNGRIGAVTLALSDITAAGGAPLNSPQLSGVPTAPTQPVGNASSAIATTAFVWSAVQESTTGVVSWNGRTGVVTLDATDINDAGGALLSSPALTGVPTAPTAATGTTTTQLATCAFVLNEVQAIGAGVTSFNTRSGNVVLELTDIESAGGAPIASPAFSGTPTVPTPVSPVAATTTIANTNWVVQYNALNTVSSFNTRIGAVTLNANDITAAGGLANPNVALTGAPTAPTLIPGTSTTGIATTAFVMAALSNLTGITVSPTPPGSPYTGQAWFNSTAGVQQLNVWTGTAWTPSTNLSGYLPLSGGQMSGSIGFGIPVPTSPPPYNPMIISGGNIGVGGVGINAYQSAPNVWNYLGGGVGAARISMASASSNLLISAAAVGTAGASVAFNTALVIDPLGNLVMQGSPTIPADTVAASLSSIRYTGSPGMTYAINGYVNAAGWRYLQAGYASQIYNDPANGSLTFTVLPSGAAGAAFGAAVGSMVLTQAGILSVSGRVQSAGGRVMAIGTGNNPSLSAFDQTGTGFVCGIWAAWSGAGGANSMLNFGQMDPNGVPSIFFGAFNLAGDLQITGTLTQGSDDRIKTVIGPYTKSLAAITQLQPITFNYKGNDTQLPPMSGASAPYPGGMHYQPAVSNRVFVGLSAQSVQAVFPECVTESEAYIDGTEVSDLRSIDTTPLLYAILNSLIEISARLTALDGKQPT